MRSNQLRTILYLVFAAAFSFAGNACADTDTDIQRATTAFYRVYLDTRPSGVPHSKARAKFTAVISHTLAQLLERADTAERHYATVTKRKVPPLLEGDLFTSLFEGAQSFTVKECHRSADGVAACSVELRHGDAAGNAATRWNDKVYLVRNGRHWVVDDIEFGGDWQFMHKGRLREILRRVIRDGNNVRP
jgi:hypothetical protein